MNRLVCTAFALVAFLGTIAVAEEVSGILEPVRAVELRPETDGAIAEVMVAEGDVVSMGQPLVRLDDAVQSARVAAAAATPADARIARAAVSVESGRSLLARVERAAQRGGAPKWEVNEAQFRLKEAMADLRLAEDLKVTDSARQSLEEAILGQFEITAPFDGIVTVVTATAGETAARAESLLVVEDLSALEATIFAPIGAQDQLFAGTRYKARLGSPLNTDVEATLRYVEPRIDPASGTIRTIFMVANEVNAAPAGVDLFVDLSARIK